MPKGKNRKVIGLTKVESGRKSMSRFVGLRAKTYSYLIDNRSEHKKAKYARNASEKNLNFKLYFNTKINHLEKHKIKIDCLKKFHKEFIRNKKSILKRRQRFKSARYNDFTEEIKKTTLSSNDDKECK